MNIHSDLCALGMSGSMHADSLGSSDRVQIRISVPPPCAISKSISECRLLQILLSDRHNIRPQHTIISNFGKPVEVLLESSLLLLANNSEMFLHFLPLDPGSGLRIFCLFILVSILYMGTRMINSGSRESLKDVPGPVLSRYSFVRNLYHAWKGDLPSDVLHCHRKYGTRGHSEKLRNWAQTMR